MSEKTEADEIEELIEKYVDTCFEWTTDCPDLAGRQKMDSEKEAFMDRIRSIIAERDQLRKVANEDLLCEQMIEDEIAKMSRNAAQRSRANV